MNKCMEMPGGGPFDLDPGQITDDSELAMCLLRALVESNDQRAEGEKREINLEAIAYYYF